MSTSSRFPGLDQDVGVDASDRGVVGGLTEDASVRGCVTDDGLAEVGGGLGGVSDFDFVVDAPGSSSLASAFRCCCLAGSDLES